jgi:ArsR family transcriptional regulator
MGKVYHTFSFFSTPFEKSLDIPLQALYNEHMNNHSFDRRLLMDEHRPAECCDYMHAHEELIHQVQSRMPEEGTLYDLAELFRIFGDSTRIRILYVLFEAEMCVCDIATLLGMTQSAISHQLRSLKNARLVKARREGKTVFYSLADEHVMTIIAQGMDHVLE